MDADENDIDDDYERRYTRSQNSRHSRHSRNSRNSHNSTGHRQISTTLDRNAVEFLGPQKADPAARSFSLAHSSLAEDDDDDEKLVCGLDKKSLLAVIFVSMVFVGLGNKVFNKLMTIPMYNYPNFLNLLTTFVYIPGEKAQVQKTSDKEVKEGCLC